MDQFQLVDNMLDEKISSLYEEVGKNGIDLSIDGKETTDPDMRVNLGGEVMSMADLVASQTKDLFYAKFIANTYFNLKA